MLEAAAAARSAGIEFAGACGCLVDGCVCVCVASLKIG